MVMFYCKTDAIDTRKPFWRKYTATICWADTNKSSISVKSLANDLSSPLTSLLKMGKC